MDKSKIIKGFDDFAAAKRSGAITMRLVLLFGLLVIIAVLIFAASVTWKAMDRIKVVDASTGMYFKTSIADNAKLVNVRIKTHCADVVHYANSFDRLTIKENQAKTIFRCSKPDAQRIFAWYLKRRGYGDALERGVIYRTELQKVQEINKTDDGWQVAFTSLLEIVEDGKVIAQFDISSEGALIEYTPQFPENPTGMYFTEYKQSWSPVKLRE